MIFFMAELFRDSEDDKPGKLEPPDFREAAAVLGGGGRAKELARYREMFAKNDAELRKGIPRLTEMLASVSNEDFTNGLHLCVLGILDDISHRKNDEDYSGGGTLEKIVNQYNEVSGSVHMSERQHLPYIKLFREIAKAYMWGCEYREKIRTLETF